MKTGLWRMGAISSSEMFLETKTKNKLGSSTIRLRRQKCDFLADNIQVVWKSYDSLYVVNVLSIEHNTILFTINSFLVSYDIFLDGISIDRFLNQRRGVFMGTKVIEDINEIILTLDQSLALSIILIDLKSYLPRIWGKRMLPLKNRK